MKMPLKYLFISLVLFAFFACKKSGSSRPGLNLKSIGPNVVSRDDLFQIDLGFTNSDNDVNDTLYMIRHVLNLKQQGLSTEFIVDSFSIPSYPGSNKGNFQLTFARRNGLGYPYLQDPASADENDTATFSFVIKNTHGLSSDTARSGKIVILAD
jgi:hypothetical protein